MSLPKKTRVSCPKCRRQYETTVYESINTDFSPTVLDDIISGDLFDARCPACGFVAHLEYDVLLNDMEHHAFIWVIHPNQDGYADTVAGVRKETMRLWDNMITRLVPDVTALREKAACLKSGKDDRVIELCKVFLEYNLSEQRQNYHVDKSFYTYADGTDVVFFYDSEGVELNCILDPKLYAGLSDMFREDLLQAKGELYPVFDSLWAHEVLQRNATMAA